MTPVSQKIAILKACGWTEIQERIIEPLPPILSGIHPTFKEIRACPDIDLDFMHEAEKSLTDMELQSYGSELSRIFIRGDKDAYWSMGLGSAQTYSWHATVEQRIEAFLRTKGLWTD